MKMLLVFPVVVGLTMHPCSAASSAATVNAQEVNHLLNDPQVVIIHGVLVPKDAEVDVEMATEQGHIPGAVLFSVSECADKTTSLPFTAPSKEVFQEYVRNLGVGNSNQIIVYDADSPTLAAARIWWMFRLFGHDNVFVLNGGFSAWKKAGFDIEMGKLGSLRRPTEYVATFRSNLIKGEDQIVENLDGKQFQLVDGRSGDLNAAIPGAINFPFSNVYDGNHLKSKEELCELFDSSNIRLESPFVVYCVGGLASCSIALAAFICGNTKVAVYDGSWSEWKADQLPVSEM